jgi:hypothetical protein
MKKLNSIILAILVSMAILSAAFAIELSTSVTSSGNVEDVHVVTLSGEDGGVFRVPRGKTFIMTDVIIIPLNPGAGRDRVHFAHSHTGRAREYWVFPNDRPFQAHFTTGLPMASGSTLSVENTASSASEVHTLISGFLK